VRLAKRRSVDAMRRVYRRFRKIQHPAKVFCIGRGKTGTTSLEHALKSFGYHLGDQLEATLLYEAHYLNGEFGPIVEFCKKFDAFQDLPFAAPKSYEHLDHAFPGAKFILTIRDSSEQWYQSTVAFHRKQYTNGEDPTYAHLQRARYIRRGFATHFIKLNKTTKKDPYNKEALIRGYESHNRDVQAYFRNRPDDFLVLNVAEAGALQKLAKFLGKTAPEQDFPWKNKT
jgi:hypothetical protein